MPHSWKAYKKAKEITDCLVEVGFIENKEFVKLYVRGIIQIKLEETSESD